MKTLEHINRPSKMEQKVAIKSYSTLVAALAHIKEEETEIEIEETQDKIVIPSRALQLLGEILKAMSEGKPVSIVPVATEFTTQAAAEFLGCSRPHIVKLLEEGKIPFTKIGRHRRIKFDDLRRFKTQTKENQQQRLIQMMKSDEESELYGA